VAQLAGLLAQPARRAEAAAALAARLGGESLLVFVRDPEIGILLPAPGFPQTLAGGGQWRAFLAACTAAGSASARLRLRAGVPERPAFGLAFGDEAAIVLLGAENPPPDLGGLDVLLPLLAAAFLGERLAATAAAQARVAGAAAEHAVALSRILDGTRAELQDALHRAEEHRAALEAANRRLQAQAEELEVQAEELEAQAEELDRRAKEREAVTLALAEREARHRALVEATTDLVWVSDVLGRIETEQPSWAAFTGQSFDRYAGFGWMDAVHPEDRAALESARKGAPAPRAPALEARIRRSDGAYRLFALRAVPVAGPDGTPVEWVNAATDVTERARLEEQLRQAQTLQAVGTLAGGLAHEVNNQMTVVLGFGRFALQALGPDHPQAADVGEMVKAAERTAGLTQQLLAFSRRQLTQPRILDLAAAVKEVSPVLVRLLGADKSLVILPSRSRRPVRADPTQVHQVLINLVANARDALAPGGRVTISLEDVDLGPGYADSHGGIHLVAGPYVLLAVSDTGCGMDRQTLAQVFQPFFTTKPPGHGAGLGLSMVYGIVKQHGGLVWAYSEPGHGTTMKVYLPAAEAAEDGEGPPPAAPAGGRSATVLLVEDEPAVRLTARRALEEAGYRVIEAEDGRHALDLVARGPALPDLVVADVVMPRLNGRELSDALSDRHGGLPTLFISGYTGDDVALRGLLPRGAPFIQKPFTPEALVREVAALLDRRA